MTANRKVIKDILSNLAVFSLPFGIISTAYFVFYGVVDYSLLALIIPFLLMYGIRNKINKIPLFVLAHILLLAVSGLVLGGNYTRAFVWTFLVCTGLFSFYLKTREEIALERIFSAVLIVLFMFLFFLARFSHGSPESFYTIIIITFLAAKCLGILYTHMDNFDYRLNILSKINGFNDPSNKISSFNNALIALFAGAVFLISIIVMFGARLAQMAVALGNIVANIISRFLDLYEYAHRRWAEYQEIGPQQLFPGEEEFHEFDLVEAILEEIPHIVTDQDALFQQLNPVYVVAGVLFAIFLVVILCRLFYKYFYKKWSEANNGKTAYTVISLDKNVMGDIIDLLPRFKTKLRHPVRRAYVKKVNKYIRAGVNVNMADTTNVIANKIRNAENIDELTNKYEKVRYGK